jgi:D-3-phosphoglycerate dehydrogenase
MAYRVAVYNAISASGLARFVAPHYAVGKALAEPDAILLRSHVLQAADIPATVKAVARAGAGVNNIPVDELTRRGVPVFNAPGANANAVKELVVAAMLLAARNLVPAACYVQALPKAADADFEKKIEDAKKQFAGFELPGRTLGVIGLGAIGGLVADTAIRLGMKVLGYDPDITVDNAWRLPSSVKRAASIDEVLKGSEFLTLHVPLNAKTRHLIGAERLAHARKGMVLLNFARDAVVDEMAVLAALEQKRLKAYICDFPSPRLQGHADVVALPHLGASTEEAEEKLRDDGGGPAARLPGGRIDRQRGEFSRGGDGARIAAPHRDRQRQRAEHGRTDFHYDGASRPQHPQHGQQVRGEMAYTLVDLDSEAAPDLLARIARIPGVLSIRAVPPLLSGASA